MNRRNRTIAITIAVVVLLMIFIGLAGTKVYDTVNPGIGNISSGRLGISKITAHAYAGQQPGTLCAVCHGDMKSERTPWHKTHLLMTFVNFGCSTCHKKIDPGPRNLNGKVMIDRTVCRRCHAQKFPAYNEDHLKPTWQRQHRTLRGNKTGGADIYSIEVLTKKYPKCFICHKQKELSFCKNCHEYHPHNDKWIKGKHGKIAVESDFSCLRCHEKKTWCTTECHQGVTLPHNIPKWSKHYADDTTTPPWLRAHSLAAAEIGQDRCAVCHTYSGKFSCNTCHHRQFGAPEPWVTAKAGQSKHPGVARREGVAKCFECHKPVFCSACHIRGVEDYAKYKQLYLLREKQ